MLSLWPSGDLFRRTVQQQFTRNDLLQLLMDSKKAGLQGSHATGHQLNPQKCRILLMLRQVDLDNGIHIVFLGVNWQFSQSTHSSYEN
jgi:hypothetical protein